VGYADLAKHLLVHLLWLIVVASWAVDKVPGAAVTLIKASFFYSVATAYPQVVPEEDHSWNLPPAL